MFRLTVTGVIKEMSNNYRVLVGKQKGKNLYMSREY